MRWCERGLLVFILEMRASAASRAPRARAASTLMHGMQRLRWPPAAPGRYAFVQAADAGVGMAPEIKEKIFEAFFTTKEKGKGTGLGLSAVQDLARESDGFVLLNSEPGKGTEVKVFLCLRGGHTRRQLMMIAQSCCQKKLLSAVRRKVPLAKWWLRVH